MTLFSPGFNALTGIHAVASAMMFLRAWRPKAGFNALTGIHAVARIMLIVAVLVGGVVSMPGRAFMLSRGIRGSALRKVNNMVSMPGRAFMLSRVPYNDFTDPALTARFNALTGIHAVASGIAVIVSLLAGFVVSMPGRAFMLSRAIFLTIGMALALLIVSMPGRAFMLSRGELPVADFRPSEGFNALTGIHAVASEERRFFLGSTYLFQCPDGHSCCSESRRCFMALGRS